MMKASKDGGDSGIGGFKGPSYDKLNSQSDIQSTPTTKFN